MKEEFNNCFEASGGITNDNSEKINFLINTGNEFINHIRKFHPKLPFIYFDFINNLTLNASAKKFENNYFIGINIGAIYIMEDLFIKISSCRSQNFDNCSKVNIVANSRGGLEYFPNVITNLLPLKEEDYNEAMEKIHLIFRFLIYHEICHILRGHLDLVMNKFNICITEISEISETKFVNIMQTFEMDADSFANNRCFIDAEKILTQNNPFILYKNLESYLYNFIYTIYCFFRIFGFYTLDLSKSKTASHPFPALRISMILNNLASILLNRKVKNINELIAKVLPAIKEAENDIKSVTFFDDQIAILNEVILNIDVIEYNEEIMKNWKKIRPQLEKYTYGILPE